jgi:hypothetical protein
MFGDRPHGDEMHVPTPSLDLRCLVRTAFSLSRQRLLPPRLVNTHEQIQAYWTNIAADFPQFAIAMELATAANYDGLHEIFGTQW